MSPATPSAVLTVDELAARWRGARTIYKKCKNGTLPAFKPFGYTWRILLADVERIESRGRQ